MRPFFEPRSIAVVGASRTPGRAGHQLIQNLASRFAGALYPVNPSAEAIGELPCYPSIAALPAPVDLAIVLVPAPRVLPVVESCAAAEIPAVMIPAAGFAEAGEAGRTRQRALVESVRGTRTRLWGPNCAGLVNLGHRLLACYVEFPPVREGRVSIVSQTGVYALGLLHQMMGIPGYGVSKIATIGNACDLTEADVLEYLADDPETEIIALHLEGVPGGARTFGLCREITRSKPVIAVVAGRTEAGARASLSHTAGLATDARVVRGLMEQAGVIPVRDFTELVAVSHALSVLGAPRPARRVGLVSTSGAACVLGADLIVDAGLEVAELSAAGAAELASLRPPDEGLRNPVDTTQVMEAMGTAEVMPRIARVLFEDPGVDAVLLAMGAFPAGGSWFSPHMVEGPLGRSAKPAVAWCYGDRGRVEAWRAEFEAMGVPAVEGLRSAVEVLAAVERAAAARDRVEVARCVADAGTLKRALAPIESARERGERALTEPETRALLAEWGIEGPRSMVAGNEAEAIAAARRVGFPVAVKGISSRVTHKREAGLVALALRDEGEVAAAVRGMRGSDGFYVQEMIRGRLELIAGFTRTPTLGTVVMLGLGGSLVEAIGEVAFRTPPLDEADARQMIERCGAGRLLADQACNAVAGALLRLARMAEAELGLSAVEINPLVVADGAGALAVDALGVL